MKSGVGFLNWIYPEDGFLGGFRVRLQNPKSGFQNLNPDLHAWTTFILARKRDCRRHCTMGVSENVVVTETRYEGWSVKSLIILRLGEGQPPSLENSVLGYFTTLNLRRFFFRTLGHCIRLKTMVITCMTCSGHQSTLPYSRLWTALEDWTCGTLTTILRYTFELYYFVSMRVKHMYYSHPISITLLPCRYQQQVHTPNQWRHWTVCGGRIQGTRLPWVTMMVTCLFMTLARWENSNKEC